MIFSLLKHYLDLYISDIALKVFQSLYCFTTCICHGVENYFLRPWGTGISDAIFIFLVGLSVITDCYCASGRTLLSPACGQKPWSGDYKTPSVRACVHVSVRSRCFCINLKISFIYEDIFTKFVGNVYAYESLSLTNFSLIFV